MLDEARECRALNGNGAPLYEAIHKVTVIYVAGKTQNPWYYAELPRILLLFHIHPLAVGSIAKYTPPNTMFVQNVPLKRLKGYLVMMLVQRYYQLITTNTFRLVPFKRNPVIMASVLSDEFCICSSLQNNLPLVADKCPQRSRRQLQ